jgi:UDP-N-acetyl-D-mannosaminuronic acid transferase (WecB/TagA/CpsF family)
MPPRRGDRRTILGIDFFQGSAEVAVKIMQRGGLLVVPAAPALKDLETNAGYREALVNADMAITDSAFMVLIWNRLQGDNISRLSGLEYLRELLLQDEFKVPGSSVWIMASPISAIRNLEWLESQGIVLPDECVYMAPMYGAEISDPELLELLYIKRNLSYLPAIHCIGAAIAFLSGDQVRIPVWADKFYVGWLFRTVSEPRRYLPRYWEARKLYDLMRRYRDRLPGTAVSIADESSG